MTFLQNIPHSSSEDSELLTLYKQSGDISILADLYQRYMDLLFAVCLKYLEDKEAAKDAVMDVFEELPLKVKKHDISNFRSWVYTVAKNHCLMQLRSPARKKSVALDETRVQFEAEMHQDNDEKEWQFEQLSKCMETLSAEQKTSIELFYLQERSYKEIGELTGLDWNRVRSLIQNGRRNLKICMDQQNGREGAVVVDINVARQQLNAGKNE